MKKETKQTLAIIWKNPEKGVSFKIGFLEKWKKNYYFKYNVGETKRALDNDFSLFSAFPSLNAQYFKENLFTTFSNMIPKSSRDKNNDEFEILKSLGASLDNNFEFINISEILQENEDIQKEKDTQEKKGNED